MSDYPYTKEELYHRGPPRSFGDDAREAAFLLGGIGTGNVSVGARGQFRDWEIFNRPGKGNYLPYTFFAIWAREDGGRPVAKILESRMQPPFAKSHGFNSGEIAGLPRLDSAAMRATYPFVQVDFTDAALPVQVSMEAFTPFIPLNAADSGIPGFIIRYKVTNPTAKPVAVTIAGSLANMVGFDGYDMWGHVKLVADVRNEYLNRDGLRGIFFTASGLAADHLQFGTMALQTAATAVTYKRQWLDGGWWDGIQDYWDDFCYDGRLEPESSFGAAGNELVKQKVKMGSLGVSQTIQPGREEVFEFTVTWYFPNRVKSWDEDSGQNGAMGPPERNYYSRLFGDAWQAGVYLWDNLARLEKDSRNFTRALFTSTLPDYVIEALAANITVIRSPTCFRIHDGTFLGWEGCFDTRGSCEGSCTHVWNYAQTMAFLFPELERTMRRVEFELETDAAGRMAFRARKVFGSEDGNKPATTVDDALPATDGQMGTIVRLYRDWKFSGDTGLLKRLWPKASSALDFAFRFWDSDGDCVLDSQQHNTYDIEFYGPNSLTNSMFYAALKAGAEMAEYLEDGEHARKYRAALERGSRKMDELLWGGEYYEQKIGAVDQYRYQYGSGCLSDQVFGQLLAHVAGLGYILPEEHIKRAVASIFRYNFRTGFETHHHVQRTYVLNDEKGLLLCSWPHGGRPKLPFVYCDEVWTGIEYQVAAHLIYEGFVPEGLTLVKAVRERHDGYRRNPWNEVECGHHYARSMASWALLLALSGFQYDLVRGMIRFQPALSADHFKTFWSTGKAWGMYSQWKKPDTGGIEWKIDVLYGSMDGIKVNGTVLPGDSRNDGD